VVAATKRVVIVAMQREDWPEVVRIFGQGIATGDASFETEPPAPEEWDRSHLREHRFVARWDDRVIGWAAVSPVSERCVYGGVVEVSVYVDEQARGQGVGRLLLERLIASTEKAGIWTIQAGIFPENEASVRLHENMGFRYVGTREALGKMNGVWRDVLLFERRSKTVT
jgi:L-amino acid N-acyltransferase YncA